METKKGVTIQSDLAKVLKAKPRTLATFERMRPSCRRKYSEWVDLAQDSELRAKRMASVLKRIEDWGRRHPIRGRQRITLSAPVPFQIMARTWEGGSTASTD